MAAASPQSLSTPKRKRGEQLWLSPIQFSFELDPSSSSSAANPDDGSNSPRSSVAHKFRGLALESGGGATSNDNDDHDAHESVRKRQRPDEMMGDAPPTVQEVVDLDGKSFLPAREPSPVASRGAPRDKAEEDRQLAEATRPADSSLHHAYPSINRLSESKSKVKKRTGSPPLRMKKPSRRPFDDEDDEEMEIVDPVRAALTWHEDEITIYDPDDEDDDGTGINGIGFKPTPALAQARTMKRRQQMAEYRKREENEARARRNQRRRRGPGITIGPEEKSPSRKVRFMDADAQNIAITTG
ncbi:uncharacterized protein NECHADRAFT_78898 [Fusarium vanettenii 77-13-4]|uniref:Uncharacterized protein n=1 Tax=Fusarium vanettenii (strain ATCC MYA-4622 / CBS 123669 / FGSC 9596 / NRRL 45880 / 77-13-4) TaxID=660122 RepID=C7YPW8_FUSV7|nr:uncharacterized protein NECHADRAFT_78898 [Fusarium vanettenii 77-13-4]EEU45923.1 hypothetical protein NECHADRAFT_78898 [Fusarium vanettenii 77-13-4]